MLGKIIGIALISIAFRSCIAQQNNITINMPEESEFNNYWYQGAAEINRYELKQARYGEIHSGEAVLIFVTEDFLKDKQVKYEFGDKSKATPILKLNFTKKFFTGIYPYSMMTSIFTPIDVKQNTIKTSTSSQEWCGHSFTQLNINKDTYDISEYSYFQSEGDKKYQVPKTLLEDELFTKIRLSPNELPLGKIELIPSAIFSRLKHIALKPYNAIASLDAGEDDQLLYSIVYEELERSVQIVFENKFPFQILQWSEKNANNETKAGTLTTQAIRTHKLMSPYWNKNKLIDRSSKTALGMEDCNH